MSTKYAEEMAYLDGLKESHGRLFAAAVALYVRTRLELSKLVTGKATDDDVEEERDTSSHKLAILTILSGKKPEDVIAAGDTLIDMVTANIAAGIALKKANERKED